jgi:hypothetical protein
MKLQGFGFREPKETEYHIEIPLPTSSDETADTSVFDLSPIALPCPFNHSLPVGYDMSGKITGEAMIEAWKVFAGPGENSHQWIETPLLPPLGGSDGRRRETPYSLLGADQHIWHRTPGQPRPLASYNGISLVLLEALERVFKDEQGHAWDDFTTQAMASIPEDVRDDRDILSMTGLLALTDSTPPRTMLPKRPAESILFKARLR